MPNEPPPLQQLRAQASALFWLWSVRQPGQIDTPEYERRLAVLNDQIAVELARQGEQPEEPRPARRMPPPRPMRAA